MPNSSVLSLGDRLETLSLEIAIDRLLHRQTKLWGCFRVVEETRTLYRLEVDGCQPLSLQLGSDGYTYKAWWGHKGTTVVVVRKRQPKLATATVRTRQSTGTGAAKSRDSRPSSAAAKGSGQPDVIPLTYEIQWRSDTRSMQRQMTVGLVQAIEGRIQQLIDELPDDGVKPRVIVTQLD